jgi:nicotinamide riboside kinase
MRSVASDRRGGQQPQLICLLGAECTGKTTLARALANHYGGLVVPEYLRQFCDAHQRTPAQYEQVGVLEQQVALEQRALAQAQAQGIGHVFCDTSALATAIYSTFYFADTRLQVRALALQARYALTLLLAPDLPWVSDGIQRASRQVQAQIHALMLQSLVNLPGVVLIQGQGQARWQAALSAVQACHPAET